MIGRELCCHPPLSFPAHPSIPRTLLPSHCSAYIPPPLHHPTFQSLQLVTELTFMDLTRYFDMACANDAVGVMALLKDQGASVLQVRACLYVMFVCTLHLRFIPCECEDTARTWGTWVSSSSRATARRRHCQRDPLGVRASFYADVFTL